MYSEYAMKETITISSEDEDDKEIAERLRSDPLLQQHFDGNVKVKPVVLIVEEANGQG